MSGRPPLTLDDVRRDPIGSLVRARPEDNIKALIVQLEGEARRESHIDTRSSVGLSGCPKPVEEEMKGEAWAASYKKDVTNWDRLFSRATTRFMPEESYIFMRENTDGRTPATRGLTGGAGGADWGTRYIRDKSVSAAGMWTPGAPPAGKIASDSGGGYRLERPADKDGLRFDPRVPNTNIDSMKTVARVSGVGLDDRVEDPKGLMAYQQMVKGAKPLTDRLGFRFRDQWRTDFLQPKFFPARDTFKNQWEAALTMDPTRDRYIARQRFLRSIETDVPLDLRVHQRAAAQKGMPTWGAREMANWVKRS